MGKPLQSTRTDVSVEASTHASGPYDFERLEFVVARLVEQYGVLRRRNADLEAKLEGYDARVRTLEEELRSANQLRQDVAKRVDELIGQIDQLDAELEAAESRDQAAASAGGRG